MSSVCAGRRFLIIHCLVSGWRKVKPQLFLPCCRCTTPSKMRIGESSSWREEQRANETSQAKICSPSALRDGPPWYSGMCADGLFQRLVSPIFFRWWSSITNSLVFHSSLSDDDWESDNLRTILAKNVLQIAFRSSFICGGVQDSQAASASRGRIPYLELVGRPVERSRRSCRWKPNFQAS